jgi:SRSO17 transposase
MQTVTGDDQALNVLQVCDNAFGELMERISPCFWGIRSRRRVQAYLQALLAPVERKNGWQIAELVGDATPTGMQQFIRASVWDEHALRDQLREYVVEHLGEPGGVLIADETGFLKKGDKSPGVQRQYSGTAGRVENCQIGVFLGYAGSRGCALIDRELYLPKSWTSDRERCREAGISDDVEFATKPELARLMLERALGAGMRPAWFLADEVYGQDRRLRSWLEANAQPYLMAVAQTEAVRIEGQQAPETKAARDLVEWIPATGWHRGSAGAGSKGPRLYDWSCIPLEDAQSGPCRHWLLIRRQIDSPHDLAFYRVWAPRETSLTEMVRAAGLRWAIEVAFEGAKQETGLAHYEVRTWTGWYRHVTLSMLAYALLAATRAALNAAEELEKGHDRVTDRLPRLPFRKPDGSIAGCDNGFNPASPSSSHGPNGDGDTRPKPATTTTNAGSVCVSPVPAL